MKGAQQYLREHMWDDAEIGGMVPSNSDPSKRYFVYKSFADGKWHCNCTAGLMGGTCSHKKTMAEKFGEGDKCFYCGTTRWAAGGLDRNHVLLRGTNPDKIHDETNIMLLCRKDHDRFHSDVEFRENLQKIWEKKNNLKIAKVVSVEE